MNDSIRFTETLVCLKFSNLIIFGIAKYDFVIKARKMFSFLPLIINSVIIGLRF